MKISSKPTGDIDSKRQQKQQDADNWSELGSRSCLLNEQPTLANRGQELREMMLQENQLTEGGCWEEMTSGGMTHI